MDVPEEDLDPVQEAADSADLEAAGVGVVSPEVSIWIVDGGVLLIIKLTHFFVTGGYNSDRGYGDRSYGDRNFGDRSFGGGYRAGGYSSGGYRESR